MPDEIPFAWMDENRKVHENEHFHFLFIHGDHDGSHDVSWSGHALADAAEAWKGLDAHAPDEDYVLTAWHCGQLASNKQMRWRYGEPAGTFKCRICGSDTPHNHTAEEIALQRQIDCSIAQYMDDEWRKIEARIAELAARYRRTPLYARPAGSAGNAGVNETSDAPQQQSNGGPQP